MKKAAIFLKGIAADLFMKTPLDFNVCRTKTGILAVLLTCFMCSWQLFSQGYTPGELDSLGTDSCLPLVKQVLGKLEVNVPNFGNVCEVTDMNRVLS